MTETSPIRDPLGLTLTANYLRNVCHEMGVAMMRTSFSSIFNEGLDFSCMIFDSKGQALANGEFCPAQIGAAVFSVQWTLDEIGRDTLLEGDVLIHNDPYRGGCHLPEHLLLKPVFARDELVGFVANLAHLTEIGGKAPGGFAADATEVYQEGLRLPPVTLMRRGERNEDVWRIILANHRTPRSTWGDLHAMVGSLNIGEARVKMYTEALGLDEYRMQCEALLDYSERRMRAEISRLRPGRYEWEDVIENDGVVRDKSYRMKVVIYIDGDTAIFDFTESDDQARGPCNTTFGVTASAVYTAMLHVTDADIPRNSGCYRPLHLVTRPGSVVNVKFPGASVGGNSEISPRIIDMIFAALAPCIPERVPASSGGTGCNFLFGGVDSSSGDYYTNYHMEGCGWGGTAKQDGNSAQGVMNGNCRNTPIEVFETRYPWRVKSLRLVPDSGGAGKFRGGLATERVIEVTADEIVVSEFGDRTLSSPWGLFSGEDGMRAMTLVRRHGHSEFESFGSAFGTASDTKFSGIVLRRGDVVLIRSAGGGGYGAPKDRPIAKVREDVREGWVSAQAAEEIYGCVDGHE